jgi:hypothetical protein
LAEGQTVNSDSHLYVCWDEPLATAIAALQQGLVSLDDVKQAAERRRTVRPLIGMLALHQRQLTMSQVFRILEVQAETNELFGLIAVKLGYLTESKLNDLLQDQARLTPSLVDALAALGTLTMEQADLLRKQIQTHLRMQPNDQLLSSLT